MSVSREHILWAYRTILGREPENEQVVQYYMAFPDFWAVRAAFLASSEFRSTMNYLEVGRHQNIDTVEVDLACTDAELSQMLNNIAREWRAFGETEPHWSVLTDGRYKPDQINANIDPFYNSGNDDISRIMAMLKRNRAWTAPGARALDFGCGVGRLSLALAPLATHVTGVDISPAHLVHARQRAELKGIKNVSFQSIASVRDIAELPEFDLIISLIVLQHNPPPVMAAIFEALLLRLREGGVAVIQMPTYIVDQRFNARDYLSNRQPRMEMNALPQNEIFSIIDKTGCRALEVREDTYMGADIGVSHTFAIQRK